MFKSLVTLFLVLAVGAPAAAQEMRSWSSTLTTEEFLIPDPDPGANDDSLVVIGYSNIPLLRFGELSDRDFNVSGTTYTIKGFFQPVRAFREIDPQEEDLIGGLFVYVSPRMDERDLNSLLFMLDGHQLAAGSGRLFNYDKEDLDSELLAQYPGGLSVIVWEDPGFGWTDRQRIAIGLNLPTERALMCPVTPQSQCQIRTGSSSSASFVCAPCGTSARGNVCGVRPKMCSREGQDRKATKLGFRELRYARCALRHLHFVQDSWDRRDRR